MAVEVVGRVGLRIPALLRVGHGPVKVIPRLEPPQDVIGGAVDHRGDPPDLVTSQRVAEHRENRDGGAHRGLERQPTARGPHSLHQPVAGGGDDGLVGGHDTQSTLECGVEQGAGRLQASQQLDHDVHVRGRHHRGRIGVDGHPTSGQLASSSRVPLRDAAQHQRAAAPGCQAIGMRLELSGDRRTDRPHAEQRDSKLCGHWRPSLVDRVMRPGSAGLRGLRAGWGRGS